MEYSIKITVITSLFNCLKYLQGYFDAVERIINKTECEFLLLHNAPTDAELMVINSNIYDKKWFKHIIVENREGLYSTWNRGINIARGIYCAIWNVDDIRFPDSLKNQADWLDHHSSCGLVVGDILSTDIYGSEGKKYYNNKPKLVHPLERYRSCIITCFPMWRKSIHEKIGFFDEQFICAGDFDFQIRVAMDYELGYIEKILGVYLENVGGKLSFNKNHELENTMIYLRYGAYEKVIIYNVLKALRHYDKNYVIESGTKNKIARSLFFTRTHRLSGFLISILSTPYYILRDIYHIIKSKTIG